MKDDKSTLLHIVECAAHIKPTVAHLLGKSRHLDTESLGAMRSDTSFGEEPFDALFQTLRRILPESTLPSLQCCREDVEEIETENQKVIAQMHHLSLVDSKDVADVLCSKCAGIVLL